MKSIRNTLNIVLSAIIVALGFGSCVSLNIVLSAIIVALGFGSCVSHRAYQAAQQEIKQLQDENEQLKQKNSSLKDEIRTLEENIMKYRRDSEQRKVVYGPRPTSFQKDIAE